MSAVDAPADLDDPESLRSADRNGLLWAASMAGAQVRATAAALQEGVLDALRSGQPPRAVIWVARRGAAAAAGEMLAATMGGRSSEPIVVTSEAPPWVGPLDVVVVAGDDPGDPDLVTAAATGVRRGARVVVVAPDEGPLRDTAAGRSVMLPPRVNVPDGFGLCRYLAAGLAVLQVVDNGPDGKLVVDLPALADELDAEVLRNSAGRDLFTNPAKVLADRTAGRVVVLAGDTPGTVALARHGATAFLRIAQQSVGAVGLVDALVALRGGMNDTSASGREASIFHDEHIDGPAPRLVRTIVLTTDSERQSVVARVGGLDEVDVVGADDIPEVAQSGRPAIVPGRPEQQLAVLAVRLEMTAVYLRLVRG